MKYLVMEIQTMNDGQVANLVYAYDDRRQAESKYFDIMHFAAISELPGYAVVLLNNEGRIIENRYFHYEPEVTPEEPVEG
jgi:hypothetical protein